MRSVLIAIALAASLAAAEPDGTTPLHRAIGANDSITAVRSLIKSGADVNAANRYGVTPLSLAAANGNDDVLRLLFEAGANAKAADAALREGRTTLMLAARTGNVAAVRLLIDKGADVNAVESRTGTTALMWAALENRADAVRALAAAGADVNARSSVTAYPHTPPGVIGDALEEGYSYVGQTVLPRGWWTALMYAARQGSVDAARALAESGADLNVADPDGTPALTFAIINGHYDLAALLVDKGADVNQPDRTGATPLYSAVDMHTLQTSFGRPELARAVTDGSVGAAKMLLAHGANPDAPLKTKILKRTYQAGDGRLAEGATPLMRAARSNDVVMMQLLIDAGADLYRQTASGDTPLLVALKTQKPDASSVSLLRELTGDYTTQAPAPAANRRR
jgi:ankyrin repeat protein